MNRSRIRQNADGASPAFWRTRLRCWTVGMCTVTLIPCGNGVRLACNRDESPLRPAALPPRVLMCGARRALMPIDSLAGGTWIAANDAGLMATLLNVYETPRDKTAPPSPSRRSRGTIIPWLMEAATLDEAYEKTQGIVREEYAAFRLVLADRHSFAEVYSPGQALVRRPPLRIAGPLLFTSSGLGDGLVDPPRRALFEAFSLKGSDWREQQDAYHRHSWPERRHLSVCMLRPEARTVSFTAIELTAERIQMTYHGDAPDQPATSITAVL